MKFRGCCLEAGIYAFEIRKDIAAGQKFGITGIPSFLVGVAEAPERVKAVRPLKGAQAYPDLKQAK